MAAGKRLFQFIAKPLTRRSSRASNSVVVKSASSASEIRKAEESPKLCLKYSRRQLKQDGEFGNRNRKRDEAVDMAIHRILMRVAFREYFHGFLVWACAAGTPFGAYYLAKRYK